MSEAKSEAKTLGAHAQKPAASARVGSIDLLKFLLAIAVVVLHASEDEVFSGTTGHLSMGGIAVEGFFVISGCLMCSSAERDAARSTSSLGEDTVRFIWRKVKGILVPYVVAVVIYFACWMHTTGWEMLAVEGDGAFCRHVFRWLPNVLLVFMGGVLQDTALINVVWYISAMLIAMLVIYPLVRRLGRNYTMVAAPFCALMLMGFVYNTGGGDYKETVALVGFAPQGLVRAFIGINLGCVAYELAQHLKSLDLTNLARALLTVTAACLLAIYFCVMEFGEDKDCYPMVLLLPAFIGVLYSGRAAGSSLLDNRVSSYLGKASTYIYLYHAALRRVLYAYAPGLTYLQALAIMLLGSFAMFVVTDLVERGVHNLAKRYDLHPSRLLIKR